MSNNRIGLIGLGIMGKPMANNLLAAGYKLGMYARRPESLESFSKNEQVEIYPSPKALAQNCDTSIICVSDSPDVVEMISDENGIIHGANEGHLLIDMSTISAEVTRTLARSLADKKIAMLDAPVSGGEVGAIDGTLSIMVGGKVESFSRALPLFKVLGKNIVHVGDHGAGQVAKSCNQILAAQTITAVAEAMLLAKSSNVDPAKVREALLGGFANSRVLDLHGQRMLDNDYKPGFKASLHLKDMNIALNSAENNDISLPGAELAAQYLRKVVEEGTEDYDSSAIAKVIFKEL